MYKIDKKKYEEIFEENKIKKQKQNEGRMEEEAEGEDDDDEPCFDIEFQYYMMLQALMLMVQMGLLQTSF